MFPNLTCVTDSAAKAPRSLYVVQSNPVPGREAEFDQWYQRHVAEVLTVPGFVAAGRWRPSTVRRFPTTADYPYSHVVTYEVLGDPQAAFAALDEAHRAGMAAPRAVAPGFLAHLFEPLPE